MKVLTAVLASFVVLSWSAHPVIAASAEEKTRLGNQLLGHGYPSDALIFYDQAVDINPYYWPAYLNRGKALLRLGQRRYAMDDFKKTLQLNPGASEARRYLGGGSRSPGARRTKATSATKSAPARKSAPMDGPKQSAAR